jgi:hypothetical protein
MSRELWNREELYELVWSKPFTELAKEFAISDVGLRKACIKLEIPVPESGYWAKLRNGKKVSQAPLAKSTRNETAYKPEKRIPSDKPDDEGPYVPPMLDEELKNGYLAALAFEADPRNHIDVVKGEPGTSLGQKTLRALKRPAKPDNPLPAIPAGCFGLRVSETAAERAVAIAEALAKAFDHRHWKLSLGEQNNPYEMHVDLFGVSMAFWLEEIMERKPHVLTANEKKDQVKNPWRYSSQRFDQNPTGSLVLKLGERSSNGYSYPGHRTRWADGKIKRIESALGDFCRECIIAAIRRRNSQVEEEIRKREFELEARKRQECEYLKSLDDRRKKNLFESLDQYDLMLRARAYIAYVRDQATAAKIAIEGDLAAWFEWAEKLSVQCDPLREHFPKYEVRDEWEIHYHSSSLERSE